MTAFTALDDATNIMADVADELEAAAALVGARERTRETGDSPRAEALRLNALEAHGFARILVLIAAQLRQAETELRGRILDQAG